MNDTAMSRAEAPGNDRGVGSGQVQRARGPVVAEARPPAIVQLAYAPVQFIQLGLADKVQLRSCDAHIGQVGTVPLSRWTRLLLDDDPTPVKVPVKVTLASSAAIRTQAVFVLTFDVNASVA